MKIYFVLLVSFLGFQCQSQSQEDKTQEKDTTAVPIPEIPAVPAVRQEPIVIDNRPPNDTIVVINDTTRIELVNFSKEIEEDSSNITLLKKCREWQLDSSAIVKMMRCAHQMDSHEWHYLYPIVKCEINCDAQISGKPFKLSINAGSHFYLTNADPTYRDTTYYFGCSDKKCEKFFVMPVDNMENQE